jgi:hypothetical protein
LILNTSGGPHGLKATLVQAWEESEEKKKPLINKTQVMAVQWFLAAWWFLAVPALLGSFVL